MPASRGRPMLGSHVFGAAAFAFGLVTLIWPDYYDWLLLGHVLNAAEVRAFDVLASIAQIAGGIAMQAARGVKLGAIVLGGVYLVIALVSIAQIVATPLVYGPWGNFFEQFVLVAGAALVYFRAARTWNAATLDRIGRLLLAVCSVSFALYQGLYPAATAGLVPKWLPPGQLFWTWATTLFFVLAAVAFAVDRCALLAARLLTAMLVMFGVVVWGPQLLSDPHNHGNWTETLLTIATAGVAWILADVLAEDVPGRGASGLRS